MTRLLLPVALVTLLSLVGPSQSVPEVVALTEDRWEDILTGEWMIEFYAPWCPACRALHPTWREFAEWTEDLNMDGIAQVDVTENPGLSGRFMVTALPTIYHVKNGEFRQYRGPRDKDAFISFIEEKKYAEIDPIPAWKDPKSIQMAAVSQFFKMSMVLRSAHTLITEDYGYPYWVSYALFGLVTILLGAVLGLVLVCVIDCIFPASKSAGPAPVTVRQRKKDDDLVTPDDELPESDQDGKPEEETKEPAVRKRRAKKAD